MPGIDVGLFMPFPLGLMPPADFIKHFLIDRLPVDRLALSFKFFDHRLHHASLNLLILRYACFPFAESTEILINSHRKPPMLMLHRFIHASTLPPYLWTCLSAPPHKKIEVKQQNDRRFIRFNSPFFV